MRVPPDDGPTTNLRSLLLLTPFYSTNLSTTYISKSELKTHPLRMPNGSANETTDFFKLHGGKIGIAARERGRTHDQGRRKKRGLPPSYRERQARTTTYSCCSELAQSLWRGFALCPIERQHSSQKLNSASSNGIWKWPLPHSIAGTRHAV